MPPKNKSQKTEWLECVKCGVCVSGRDLTKHTEVCQLDKDTSEWQHGYLNENILHAQACLLSEKDVDIKLSESCKERLVYLSPSTMKICEFSIGQPVVIDAQFVMTAWPLATVQPAMIGYTKKVQQNLGLESGKHWVVENLSTPHLTVAHISAIARTRNEFIQDPAFINYVITASGQRFFTVGNVINIRYFGQPCQLLIKEMSAEDGTTIAIKPEYLESLMLNRTPESLSTTIDNISLSLSGLDIQDTSRRSQPCTPQRNQSDDLNKSSSSISDSFSSAGESAVTSTPKSGRSIALQENFRTPGFRNGRPISNQQKLFFQVSHSTKLTVLEGNSQGESTEEKAIVTYESIGGLSGQIETIRQMIELPLREPQHFKLYGLPPPKGVLLFGPAGTGKTMLARAIAHEAKAHFIPINGPEIWSKFYGETEGRLRNIFKEAHQRAPCIIFIDELDALCPKRENMQSEMEKRVVSSLLTLMDGIETNNQGHVLVMAATNKPDSVDPALRRPGRLDREIEIGVPNAKERYDILKKLLVKVPHTLSPTQLQDISDSAHGFVGADIAALCKEAGLHALKCSRGGLSAQRPLQVTHTDFSYAMSVVQPSAMREVAIDVPKVLWSDIGGQAELKHKLKQAVEWPLKHPESFARMGIRPPRGILMYGPPGCSKTMIAKALATESGLNFIAIKGPELFSKWVGESERAVREVFRKARAAAPSIVFFDEIDALAVERGSSSGGSNVGERVLAQLLTEIDGVEKLKDVTIVAATNRPDMIDKALMRPGRIDRIVYVPLPDEKTREEIFSIHFRKMPIDGDVSLQHLVEKTKGYSGAEVSAVCHEAALSAMQEDIQAQHIYARHFDHALKTVQPRLSQTMVNFYDDYAKQSGLHAV